MHTISTFDPTAHREQVAALWQCVFAYGASHNEPHFAIDKKVAVKDGLFFVALAGAKVIGTAMAGYDGHRGWIYSLAVLPEHRGHGVGSKLVRHAEQALVRLGCPKINLQVVNDNEAVQAFYHKLGYQVEPRFSMGKVIKENVQLSPSR